VISWGFEGAQVKVNTAHIPTGDNEGDFTLDACRVILKFIGSFSNWHRGGIYIIG
jgi:hypothetical protein